VTIAEAHSTEKNMLKLGLEHSAKVVCRVTADGFVALDLDARRGAVAMQFVRW
jgi:hypothetical protein